MDSEKPNAPSFCGLAYSFGQPCGGRSLRNERLVAPFQAPSIFRISGFGPRTFLAEFRVKDFMQHPYLSTIEYTSLLPIVIRIYSTLAGKLRAMKNRTCCKV